MPLSQIRDEKFIHFKSLSIYLDRMLQLVMKALKAEFSFRRMHRRVEVIRKEIWVTTRRIKMIY